MSRSNRIPPSPQDLIEISASRRPGTDTANRAARIRCSAQAPRRTDASHASEDAADFGSCAHDHLAGTCEPSAPPASCSNRRCQRWTNAFAGVRVCGITAETGASRMTLEGGNVALASPMVHIVVTPPPSLMPTFPVVLFIFSAISIGRDDRGIGERGI